MYLQAWNIIKIFIIGTGHATKSDEFTEKFQGGHFQSKNLYCRFWTFFWFLTETKRDQAGLSHVYGKIRPQSAQFWF